MWAFVFLLAWGGSQFSESYPTRADCAAAAAAMAASSKSPSGAEVAKVYTCFEIKR
jgi:hypothetical protein